MMSRRHLTFSETKHLLGRRATRESGRHSDRMPFNVGSELEVQDSAKFWSTEHPARTVSCASFIMNALNLDAIQTQNCRFLCLLLRFSIVIKLVIYKRIRVSSASNLPLGYLVVQIGPTPSGKVDLEVIKREMTSSR